MRTRSVARVVAAAVGVLTLTANTTATSRDMTPWFQCFNVGKALCMSTTGGDPELYIQCVVDYELSHCDGLPGDPE